ncbi:NAD-dependent DNA ligase LigA [Candidatus Omnitrophus magneticus]|uniref:DNA ligase n=1 Tax=Candidatus Omnitrophus magneticus TaxID=1609969 RepID=A0A0F0CJX4_9BACT|nr:NAD-dependent DNA ligase LigA [Candidatus Omnitrophus magneticus]
MKTNDNNLEKRIKKLQKEIKKHNQLYYTLGKPVISDLEYDKLLKELATLESEYNSKIGVTTLFPDFEKKSLFESLKVFGQTKPSPTRTVGAPINKTQFSKVAHTAPMLSLESITTKEECLKFDADCKKKLGVESLDYMVEPKLDGLSVELVYENGVLTRAVTRGDGLYGEEVTSNIKVIKTVPCNLKGDNPPRLLALRGEIIMHIADFQALNKIQAESGKEVFANPRNAASGSIRQLDSSIIARRKLHVYCYKILTYSEKMPDTDEKIIELIKNFGVPYVPRAKHCAGIMDAINYHIEFEKKRDSLEYEIDGVVINVNRIDYQEKLGTRTNNPHWAIAYKFEPRKEITRVENIVIQVGRTGVMTPVALLKPVEVGGVTVSRATLHNMDEIAKLDIKIGDYVRVQRAGDVIPKVTEVLKERRDGDEQVFHMPLKCPSCFSLLEKEDVFYRCLSGISCPAQLKESIAHYASKGACDIEGLSDKTVEQFYDEGLVSRFSDIYNLKKEGLLRLEGWKDKKADNLLNAIERSKNTTLDRFIFAMGIRNVGKHIANILSEKFLNLERLMSCSIEELMEIKEIGPETAQSIFDFFNKENHKEEIKRLLFSGVSFQNKKTGGKLVGKKIVFTGVLSKMSRKEAEKLVENEGGEAQANVSNDTDFLVIGENPGSKLDDARKKGIKILIEKEFFSQFME